MSFDWLTHEDLRRIVDTLAQSQLAARDLAPAVQRQALHDAISTAIGSLRAYCDAPAKREPSRETARPPRAAREIA